MYFSCIIVTNFDVSMVLTQCPILDCIPCNETFPEGTLVTQIYDHTTTTNRQIINHAVVVNETKAAIQFSDQNPHITHELLSTLPEMVEEDGED